MERPPDPAQLRKKRSQRFHKAFFILDSSLTLICFILSLVMVHHLCAMSFFCFFSIFYLGQSIQHYLCLQMPRIDVVLYDARIKCFIGIVSAIEIAYFLVAFIFWSRSDLHPIYCYLIQTLGLPFAIGIIFILHFIGSLLLYIQCLHEYITRKYYLLALGGFAVEQRLIRERQQAQRQVALLEPFYNEYPVFNNVDQRRKSYKFDDIPEDTEGEEVCSICLTRDKEGFHNIYTPCKHFFHRECIQDWAKINSKCPECRASFKELEDGLVIQQKGPGGAQ